MQRVDQWQPIETEPADGSDIWLSDGERVWLGHAHVDGSLKLPNRSACRFWMSAEIPAPPGFTSVDELLRHLNND